MQKEMGISLVNGSNYIYRTTQDVYINALSVLMLS
jgi:hypothetical protein